MTSKNLFFSLMKENLKRRLWVVALLSLYFFFAFPVWTAMLISDYMGPDIWAGSAEYIAAVKTDVLERFLGWNSIGSGGMVVMMTLFAIICAVSGFSYLFSRQKVDFFHSQPVRREMLFATTYINGILFTAVPYLLGLVLASVLVQVKAAPAFPWGTVLTTFAMHMAFFILIYSTVVVAIMLTGNIIVSILGTIVFFAYGPTVIFLKFAFYESFFATFNHNDNFPLSFLTKTSPIAWYMSASSPGADTGMRAVGALAAAAVLTVFALFLYKKRPSEAAGKAMAFKKSQPVIKILIVVPAALLGGLFFYEMKNSNGWGVFGLLCGLIITYCIIEIIYNFDFRRLFAHKIHLAVCLVISAAIFSFFRFDLSGYDTYLPEAGQIVSGGVYSHHLDSETNQDYRVTANLSEYKDYVWFDYGDVDGLLREMELTDTEDLLTIARQGIQELKRSKDGYVYADDGSMHENKGLSVRVTVLFNLKNGKHVSRCYDVNWAAVEAAMFSVYSQPEYKEAVYPILRENASDIAAVNYQEYDDFRQVKLPDEAMKEKLLTTYQKELRGLTAETRTKESPVAAIQFKTNQIQEMIDTMKAVNGNIYTFNYYYYYPVYPSFTETIALLKQCGIEVGQFLNSNNVEKIEVIRYNQNSVNTVSEYDGETETEAVYDYDMTETDRVTVTDPVQIEEILRVSYADDLDSPNALRARTQDYQVTAYRKNSGQTVEDEDFHDKDEWDQTEDEDYTRYNLHLFEDAIPAFLTK